MKLQESMTGFYYVGTKRANITKLVNIYKRGYASCNLNRAMDELMNREHSIPEVIFCESGFGFTAIKNCAERLSRDERLQRVPFIIDAETVSAVENYHFQQNRTLDDMINLKAWDEKDLNMKIRDLQKLKSHVEEEKVEIPATPSVKKRAAAFTGVHRILHLLAGFL